MSPDLTDVTVPLWSVAATTHVAHFHQLGSSEAYLNTPTPNKKLDFWEDWSQKSYAADTIARHKAFFDHWLKGIDNGVMDTPPVRARDPHRQRRLLHPGRARVADRTHGVQEVVLRHHYLRLARRPQPGEHPAPVHE